MNCSTFLSLIFNVSFWRSFTIHLDEAKTIKRKTGSWRPQIEFLGQVQLTVKGSLNRTFPRFKEPFLGWVIGYVKVPRIEEAFDSRNLLPSTALDPNFVTCGNRLHLEYQNPSNILLIHILPKINFIILTKIEGQCSNTFQTVS